MKKKNLVLIILFLSLLVISACSGANFGNIGRGRQGVDSIASNPNYRTGSEGLTVQFAPGSADRAFERDNDVTFVLEVRNRGAFPQQDDFQNLNPKLWIYGYDPLILFIDPDEFSLDEETLEGKNPFNSEGGFETVILRASISDLPSGTPVYRPTIIAAVTYEYETVASGEVCVDPFPFSTTIRDKICNVAQFRNVNIGSSQGAPVAISRVEEEVTSNALLFRIFIKNVGNGLIIPINDVNRHPRLGYEYNSLNEVRVAEISVGNLRVDSCRPYQGERIKLINNEGVMFCKFSTSGIDDIYTTPINIRLEYGYVTSVQKQIQIFEDIGI